MKAMIAVLASMVLGLLASCSGDVQTDLNDTRQVTNTDGPATNPDYVWYDSEADDIE